MIIHGKECSLVWEIFRSGPSPHCDGDLAAENCIICIDSSNVLPSYDRGTVENTGTWTRQKYSPLNNATSIRSREGMSAGGRFAIGRGGNDWQLRPIRWGDHNQTGLE